MVGRHVQFVDGRKPTTGLSSKLVVDLVVGLYSVYWVSIKGNLLLSSRDRALYSDCFI